MELCWYSSNHKKTMKEQCMCLVDVCFFFLCFVCRSRAAPQITREIGIVSRASSIHVASDIDEYFGKAGLSTSAPCLAADLKLGSLDVIRNCPIQGAWCECSYCVVGASDTGGRWVQAHHRGFYFVEFEKQVIQQVRAKVNLLRYAEIVVGISLFHLDNSPKEGIDFVTQALNDPHAKLLLRSQMAYFELKQDWKRCIENLNAIDTYSIEFKRTTTSVFAHFYFVSAGQN